MPQVMIPDDVLKTTRRKLAELEAVVKGDRRLLILTHDNPDPDSVSSALCLRYILQKLYGVQSRVGYGGIVGRAENQAMIKVLRLPVHPVSEKVVRRYKKIALIDTQPRFGNNSFPSRMKPSIVIDHHPLSTKTTGHFIDVRNGFGATATILTQYLVASGLEITPRLATALFYGIASETQNLGREAEAVDMQAYLTLFPVVNKRALSHIEHPNRPREFFIALQRALTNAFTYRNAVCSNLGVIDNPDMVSQVADYLLTMERATWSMCVGQVDDTMLFSLRTTNRKAKAGRLAQRLVKDVGRAGGHGMIAAGQVDCGHQSEEKIHRTQEELFLQFLKLLGHKDVVELRPLLPVAASSTEVATAASKEIS